MADNFPQSLLPEDDPPLSAADQLAVAIAGAIGGAIEVKGTPADSYGRTWVIDPVAGGFRRRASGEPLTTSDIGALEQWALMALHTERYAHPIYSDAFGVERGSAAIGQFATAALEKELQASITRALLQHERVTAVNDLNPTYDPDLHVINIGPFRLITDDDEVIVFGNIQVQES